MRAKCLAQEHNTLSPARARTRTAGSGVERTNHEATQPELNKVEIKCLMPFSKPKLPLLPTRGYPVGKWHPSPIEYISRHSVKTIHTEKDIGERSRIEKIMWHAECRDAEQVKYLFYYQPSRSSNEIELNRVYQASGKLI